MLAGGVRTATVRAVENSHLLKISKPDFERLIASDYHLAEGIERISHARAISNLATSNVNPEIWAKVANQSLDRVSRLEANKLLAETGKGAGMAIALGNVLDTIPGCLVIGAKFKGFETLSLSLMVGMFFGGVPEAAASAAMLSKAGYRPKTHFQFMVDGDFCWNVGRCSWKGRYWHERRVPRNFSQALAGGAVLALVAHAMISEAISAGGSLVVLPTVAGFLFALYLALSAS